MTQPEKKFRNGACSVSIFTNTIEKEGRTIEIPKVSFQKRYQDSDGVWKTSSSLDVNDIPKALMALSKAYNYLTTKEQEEEEVVVVRP